MAFPDRLSDGTFPEFAWPGGYPIVYVLSDGEILCAPCASNGNGSLARTENGPGDAPKDGWLLVGFDIHYEGADEICAHCGVWIPSAYGDPDKEDN